MTKHEKSYICGKLHLKCPSCKVWYRWGKTKEHHKSCDGPEGAAKRARVSKAALSEVNRVLGKMFFR